MATDTTKKINPYVSVATAYSSDSWDSLTKAIQNVSAATSDSQNDRNSLIIALINTSGDLTMAWGAIDEKHRCTTDVEEAQKLYKAAYFLKTAYTLAPKNEVAVKACIVEQLSELAPFFDQVAPNQQDQARHRSVDPESYLSPIENFASCQKRAFIKN